MKRCPYCDEEVREKARKCKHCGSVLHHTDNDTLDSSVTIPSALGQPSSSPQYDTLDVAVTHGQEPNILGSQYRIVKKIGEGGMGIVYLAEDIEMGDRKVAIKVLPPVLSRNARAVDNLRREAITAINLNHPNIIRLYGFHSDGDIKFLVMEYIDGVTLEEKLFAAPSNKLTLDETIDIASKISAGLDYAHTQHPPVVHRDLKSSNVMLDKHGTVKILDFGIAREIHDSYTTITGKGDTSGTLPYMSPEQLRGQKPAPTMDSYSLGIICYECLNGKVPLSTGAIDYQIIHEPPASIPSLDDHTNNSLQKILSKDPKDRPGTCQALINLLKSKPEPIVTPKPVQLEPYKHPQQTVIDKDEKYKPKEPNSPPKSSLSTDYTIPTPKEPVEHKKSSRAKWIAVILFLCLIAYIFVAISVNISKTPSQPALGDDNSAFKTSGKYILSPEPKTKTTVLAKQPSQTINIESELLGRRKAGSLSNSNLVPIYLKLPKPMFVGTPQNIRVPGGKLEKPLGKPRPPFLAPAGVTNVAAGKPVSASDDFPVIGEVEMVTDGDKEGADGSYVDLGPFQQYVTIDLEEAHEIYAVVVWHFHKQGRAYIDVVVQLADDPDFTTNVCTIYNNDHDNSAGLGVGEDWHYVETSEGKLIDAKGNKARYVRLYSEGNSSDDSSHYIEVEVYGK